MEDVLQGDCLCYVFTIKKSGTHLLKNLFDALGLVCINRLDYFPKPHPEPAANSARTYVLSHLPPSRSWREACQLGHSKIIMNLRDPRAVFLSLLDFFDWRVPSPQTSWLAVEFRRQAYKKAFPTREDLGLALIHDEYLDDDPYTPWLNLRRNRTLFHHPGVLKVRYEDFFQDDAKEDLILRVCRYLGQPDPKDPGSLLGAAIAAPSPTKNVMLPDRWRTDLSPRLLEAFMERNGDLVREYGYPPD